MTKLEPLKKSDTPLYLQVHELVLNKIAAHEWVPGQKLPSDRELSAMLGVNAITLSKALNMLRDGGYLTRFPGHGTYVAESSPELTVSRKTVALVFDDANTDTFQKNFFLELHKQFDAAGLSLLFFSSDANSEKQLRQLKQIVSDPSLSGCLFWSILNRAQAEELLECKPKNFPLVFIDKYYEGLTHDYAAYSNYRCAREMGKYLLGKGVERFIWIEKNEEQSYSSLKDRYNGLLSAIKDHPLEKYLCKDNDFPAIEIDEKQKTAVIFSTHVVAAMAAREFEKLKKQTEIVIFEVDIEVGKKLSDYTGFRFSSTGLADEAVDVLLKRLKGDKSAAICQTADWQVIKSYAEKTAESRKSYVTV